MTINPCKCVDSTPAVCIIHFLGLGERFGVRCRICGTDGEHGSTPIEAVKYWNNTFPANKPGN
jgi:hypothetical protein